MYLVNIFLIAWLVCNSSGATYYVWSGGSNGDGLSLVNAKTTIQGAVNLLSSGGNTIIITNGTYSERVAFATTRSGSSGSPNVIKGTDRANVIWAGGFTVSQGAGTGFIQWRDMRIQEGSCPDWEGMAQFYHNSSGAAIGQGYILSNVWFEGTLNPVTRNVIGLNMDTCTNAAACARDFTVQDCVFTNLTQYSASVYMSNGFWSGVRFDFANSHDALHLWGNGNTFSNCLWTNISKNVSVSDHTDLIQSWGADSAPVEATNMTFINCTFKNSDAQFMQLELDIDSTGSPYLSTIGGWTFINCFWTGITGHGSVDFPAMKWYYCGFYKNRLTDGTDSLLYLAGAGNPKGIATGSTFQNCWFLDNGAQSGTGESIAGFWDVTELGLVPSFTADYNYVGGAAVSSWPAKTANIWTLTNTVNLHSINGGDPKINTTSFHLDTGSALIDTGTTISGIDYDADLVSRPQGVISDIGMYEFSGGGGGTSGGGANVLSKSVRKR